MSIGTQIHVPLSIQVRSEAFSATLEDSSQKT